MLSELTTLQGNKRTHVTMMCFVRIRFITSQFSPTAELAPLVESWFAEQKVTGLDQHSPH